MIDDLLTFLLALGLGAGGMALWLRSRVRAGRGLPDWLRPPPPPPSVPSA